MKKIALTVAAVASLGLVACGGGAETAATNDTNTVTDLGATGDEAVADVNAAASDAVNAADAALDNAGEAVENASDAVANLGEAAAQGNAQ